MVPVVTATSDTGRGGNRPARGGRNITSVVAAAAATANEHGTKIARFIDEQVTPRILDVVDSAREKLSIRGPVRLPLASTTTIAPDASHPHLTTKFAPSLPKKKRDELRRDIAEKLKGRFIIF